MHPHRIEEIQRLK